MKNNIFEFFVHNLTGTLPVNNKHLTGKVPVNKKHLTGTLKKLVFPKNTPTTSKYPLVQPCNIAILTTELPQVGWDSS